MGLMAASEMVPSHHCDLHRYWNAARGAGIQYGLNVPLRWNASNVIIRLARERLRQAVSRALPPWKGARLHPSHAGLFLGPLIGRGERDIEKPLHG